MMLRSARVESGNRSSIAVPYAPSVSDASRCCPVDTSSSPLGYRRAISPMRRAIPVCTGGNSSVSRKVLGIVAGGGLQLPESGVLEEDADRGEPRQHGAAPALQEPALQHVGPEEGERRPQQQVAEPRAAAVLGEVLGTPRGVKRELAPVMGEVAVGGVLH